jgi:phosphoribosylglycinamide formyltransferase-1
MSRPRLAVLISGRGSNMLAIAAACARGSLPVEISAVISDRDDAPGLAAARDLGLRTVSLSNPSGEAVTPWRALEPRLASALVALQPDIIALAGFMRILSADLVTRHAGHMLNIHPSLLPAYRGLHTHRRALEAGEPVHGASVHFVVPELDAGPTVLQARVPVRAGDDELSLSGRVQSAEHIIYPRAIGWLAAGRLLYQENRAWLDGRPLDAPVVEEFA